MSIQLDSLPPREFRLLLLVAMAQPVGGARLLQLCRATRLKETEERAFTADSLKLILRELARQLPVVVSTDGYSVSPELQTLALRESVRRDELAAVAPVVRDMLDVHSYYASRNPRTVLFDFQVAFHLERYSDAYDKLELLRELAPAWYSTVEPLFQVVCRPFDAAFLEALPPGVQGWVLPWVLQRALRAGTCPDEFYEWLCAAEAKLTHEALCWVGDIAFLRGDAAVLERTQLAVARSMERHRQAGMRLFLAGDMGRAREEFDAFCAALRGHTKRRVVPADGLAGICHVLTLLASPDPDDEAVAGRYVAVALRDRDVVFGGAYSVLKRLVQRALDERETSSAPPAVASDADCLCSLLHGLGALWFPTPPFEQAHAATLLRARLSKFDTSLKWLIAQSVQLVRELEAVSQGHEGSDGEEAVPAGAPKPLEMPELPFPLSPLSELLSQEPDWAVALSALDRLAISVPTGSDSEERRISWVIHPASLEIMPYLQRRKGAGWSAGKKVALKHLGPTGEHHELLTEADRRVVEHTQVVDGSTWKKTKASHQLPPEAAVALVGHPLVFAAGDTAYPLDVTRGHVTLSVEEHEGALTIHTRPANIDREVFVDFSMRRAVVYSLTVEQFRMVRIVGERLHIPASGRPQAAKVLGRLTAAFVVEGSEGGEGREVETDSTPWLRLLPGGAEISVQASVRPLGALGPGLVPGEGGKVVMARVEGESLQTVRSLNDELERIDQLEQACTTLTDTSIGGCEWLVEGIENCLALIAELRDVASLVHVEWPRGRGGLKVRGRAGLGSLTGRLDRERGWYVATGQLEVDDSTQLQLQELLNLYDQSNGRFIALDGGGYLELENELRDMLQALSAARDNSRKDEKVGIATCALNAISYFSGDESGLVSDAEVQSVQSRIEVAFARTYEPPPGLRATLRDYQREGFEWLCRLADVGFGACLADDMGLGKTVQLIALLLHRMTDGAALVVAPTSVCSNWRTEIERFAPSLEVIDFSGQDRGGMLEQLRPGKVLICSYTLLQQDIDELAKHRFATAILDEAQFIKNPQSRRAKAAFALDSAVRIAATGTPVENHLGDLWSLFHFLNPGLLHSWPNFSRRFVLPIETKRNDSASAGLRRLVQPFLLRRTKAQVLSELPPLTEVTLNIELSQEEKELYEACKRQALSKLQSTKKERRDDPRRRFKVLAEITRLRRLCCHPVLVLPETQADSSKLAAFSELVEELIDGGHRALVFSQFVDVLHLARTRLEKAGVTYEYLDGSTSTKQRQARVDSFQNGTAPVFLISLKAGGFGLNLTAADYVIHLDPWWNPAAESQASDRAHRIGQERPVTVYRLIAKDTVEDRILALHEKKRELADALLADADQASRLTEDDLLQLFS